LININKRREGLVAGESLGFLVAENNTKIKCEERKSCGREEERKE